MNYWVENPSSYPPYDGWDGFNIRVSTNNGSSWTILTNQQVEPDYTCNYLYGFGFQHGEGPNIPGYAGHSNGWTLVTANLSAYVGQTIRIRFAFASDLNTSTQTNPNFFCWQIDEIRVFNGATPLFYNNGEDSTGFLNRNLVPIGGDLWHVETWGGAPSPTHMLRCGIPGGNYNPNMRDAVESPYIDLRSYSTGIVTGDFMVMGDISDQQPYPNCDFWSVQISPDSGSRWFNVTNPWGDSSGTNFVYINVPATWSSFVQTYAEANLDFTPYLGYVCQFRVVLESDADQPTGIGLLIDDVQIDYANVMPIDCGCTALHIPFPTSVGFQTHGHATFTNLGTTDQSSVPARWQVQGSSLQHLTPDFILLIGQSLTKNFNWTPTAAGTYWHKAWTDLSNDQNRANDTLTIMNVEVMPQNQWILGYDNRIAAFSMNYQTGQGAACRFTPSADGIGGTFDVHQARFLFSSAQTGTHYIRLHVYEGSTSEVPGSQIISSSITVGQNELNPVWKTVDLSGIPALQNRTANFWFWLEVTTAGSGERYPEIMGDSQVWGDSHFFVYDSSYAQPSTYDYMIRALVEPTLGVADQPIELIPGAFELSQNYPNPFNPATTIQFHLPFAIPMTLKIYNLMGQEVATLIDQTLAAGTHQVEFDAKELSSGIYFYQIQAGAFRDMKKMVLLK
jgi:hypothetical protein